MSYNLTPEEWDQVFADILASDEGFNRELDIILGESAALSHSEEFGPQIVVEQTGADSPENPYSHEDFYEVQTVPEVYSKKFRVFGDSLDFTFKNLDKNKDVEGLVRHAIQKGIDRGFELAGDSGKVGLVLTHQNQKITDNDLTIKFSAKDKLTTDKVFNELNKIVQSNKSWTLDTGLQIKVTAINPPPQPAPGNGRKRNAMVHWDKYKKEHSGHGGSLVQINNTDNLCLARAVVTGIAKIENNQYQTVRRGDNNRCTLQKTRAKQMMQNAGLDDHDGPCGYKEVEKIEAAMPADYQLKVYDREFFGRLHYPKNPQAHARRLAPKIVTLLLEKGHYDLITSIAAFFGQSYWCHYCNKGYVHKEQHRCKSLCLYCRREGKCPDLGEKIICKECNRFFKSKACYDRHKEVIDPAPTMMRQYNPLAQYSTCSTVKLCPECGKSVQSESHRCGKRFCRLCRRNVPMEDFEKDEDTGELMHSCFMQPVTNKKRRAKNPATGEEEGPDYVFYDFETSQNTVLRETEHGNIRVHKIVCAHARLVCHKCIDESQPDCQVCSEKLFYGNTARNEFCAWLYGLDNVIAMAHNAKGFDGQFVLQWLHERSALEPKIISTGLKIIRLEAGGVLMLDSCEFLNMPLDKIAGAYEIKGAKKGTFPYLFIKDENLAYVGPIPDKKFFCTERMEAEELEEFTVWYDQMKDKEYDFKKEMVEYIKMDTLLLQEGCRKFRKQFMEITGDADPFRVSTTIASACNYLYRYKFLRPKTIGLVPPGGYRNKFKHNTSMLGTKYLDWLERTRNISIEREKWIEVKDQNGQPKKFRADGFIRESKTVIEFNGQIWHGCPCIKNRDQIVPKCGLTVQEVYENTERKKALIIQAGFNFEEYWECCNLKRDLEENEEMSAFFKAHESKGALDPRDAFYGGRTNGIKLYHKCKEGEKIGYCDVCSLYPWVCKSGLFPLGHPEVKLKKDLVIPTKDNQPYFGLIKCKILPPKYLYHPVLPCRIRERTMFVCCRTCAEEGADTEECDHTESQRMLDGEWVSLEIDKALEMGYEIKDMYEVYHYAERTDDLFKEYINTFLKLKTEASGYPKSAKTPEEQVRFIEEYEEKENLQLDPTKMVKNAALKSLSKLCLNSFWGKFGQRDNLTKASYFLDANDFFQLFYDDTSEMHNIIFVSEKMVVVSHSKVEEYIDMAPNVNPIIAAFVTAQARLKLYIYMQPLAMRAIYMDTDSIIYTYCGEDEYKVPHGNFLGDMKDELEEYGEGAYIDEFVCCGPKNYAYQIVVPGKEEKKHVCKVKGLSMDPNTRQKVHFVSMRETLFKYMDGIRDVIEVKQTLFGRTKARDVTMVEQTKKYRVVYVKRVLKDDFMTYPYGYK